MTYLLDEHVLLEAGGVPRQPAQDVPAASGSRGLQPVPMNLPLDKHVLLGAVGVPRRTAQDVPALLGDEDSGAVQ